MVVLFGTRSLFNLSVMMFHCLESPLEPKLYGSGSMRIERMQERSPGNAICPTARLKPSRVLGARIATDYVVSATARVVGIVYPELSVIENIESVGMELNLARFGELEV